MGGTVNSPMIERIQREAGVPDLLDALVERLTPTPGMVS